VTPTADGRRTALPGTVVALGWVSLCTDLGSEMILPLLPAFVAGLGAGPRFLGLLEGAANAVVALLKLWAGARSDRGRRKPWVMSGYGLSALARPLMALAPAPAWVLAVRLCDRVGKGIRAAPRDALVAGVVTAATRGRAFGLQRAMDHAGALGGALVAAALLWLGCTERTVFALAAVPGAAAVVVLWRCVREPERAEAVATAAPAPDRLRPGFRPFLVVAGVSSLGTVIDLQLIYRAQQLGVDTRLAPLLWVLLHAARSLLALPFGTLSDRLGRRAVIAWGLVAQGIVLLLFGLASAPWMAWVLFPLHGLHAACTEGAERGLVADLGGRKGGRAFGLSHLVCGLAGLPLAVGFGALYQQAGALAGFGAAAGLSALALLMLLRFVPAGAAR
jgi:MFS family permease